MDIEKRKNFIKIIETEKLLDGRFCKIKSINELGGLGNFSIVFSAFDEKTGQKVALKFYDPSKTDDIDRVKRFEREAKILHLLGDEKLVINIVGDGTRTLQKEFIDPGTRIRLPYKYRYLAMDLADSNLEDLLDSDLGNDARVNLYVFREVIKSVFRLHRRKICHRDLKPDNFLIKDDKILMSDLGTSKAMNGGMYDISDEYFSPVGHRDYLAPEQYLTLGIADELVYKSDLFAIGAILFEMFTGSTYTTLIYNDKILSFLLKGNEIFSGMREKHKKIETYKDIISDLSKSINPPDIYTFNDRVPNCIKNHLNKLYKQLVEIDVFKRQYKPVSIFRQIDICILTLENELKYQEKLKEKRRRKKICMERKQIINYQKLRTAYMENKEYKQNVN